MASPTDRAMITGRQWVSLFASAMGKNNQVAVLPKWALASTWDFHSYTQRSQRDGLSI